MIKAKKLQKSYGSVTVLSDASFSLERGQKVALVGENGTGKTTLLKIVAGIEKPDSGVIEMSKGICIGYLPQDTSLAGNESISEYLRRVSGIAVLEKEIEELLPRLEDPAETERYGEVHDRYERLNGYAFTHRMEVMLAGFGLDGVGLDRKLSNLSSGQKSKVVLAGILLTGVDLLLLDEPTNNLDLPALIWLEDFLQNSKAACVVISHDRRFLDRVVRKIFELNWHSRTITVSSGTYSDYLEMVSRRSARQKSQHEDQKQEIGRLKDTVREKRADASRGARWKGTDNDKALKGFKRDRAGKSSQAAKVIERRIDQIELVEKPFERDPFKIPLEAEDRSGSLDIRCVDIVAGYGRGFKVGPISFELRYGKRMGIMGDNGSGKSTLLKTIMRRMPPLSGKIEIGSGIRIGNMMQEHETLPRSQTILGFMAEYSGLSEQDSYSKLAKFGLEKRIVKSTIGTLSPGGRARLLLALFSAQSVNMLVLDEPTNHLDLEALSALEEVLKTYSGTVLLVSHDRYFLEQASLDSVYVLEDGNFSKISNYKAYSELAEERAQRLLKML